MDKVYNEWQSKNNTARIEGLLSGLLKGMDIEGFNKEGCKDILNECIQLLQSLIK